MHAHIFLSRVTFSDVSGPCQRYRSENPGHVAEIFRRNDHKPFDDQRLSRSPRCRVFSVAPDLPTLPDPIRARRFRRPGPKFVLRHTWSQVTISGKGPENRRRIPADGSIWADRFAFGLESRSNRSKIRPEFPRSPLANIKAKESEHWPQCSVFRLASADVQASQSGRKAEPT